MKQKTLKVLDRMARAAVFAALGATILTTSCTAQGGAPQSVEKTIAPAPNGIPFPAGYKDWRVIAVSHRTDNDSLRIILGNDAAVQAARSGHTNPWPDGAILGKLVFKDTVREDDWPAATVPGRFIHAEFMHKDAARYAATGGWGFARWLGDEQKPYGDDASFVQECFACHTPMKDHDYVFTHPVKLP